MNEVEFKLEQIHVKNIKEGERFRKDEGDIAGLISSITQIGLLQPIGVVEINPKERQEEEAEEERKKTHLLVYGGRRFKALKHLFHTKKIKGQVPCRVYKSLTELELRIRELEENVYRKDLTFIEDLNLKNEIHSLHLKIKGPAIPGKAGGGHRVEDTANKFGVSKASMSRDLNLVSLINKMPKEMQEKVKKMKTKKEAQSYINQAVARTNQKISAKSVEKANSLSVKQTVEKQLISSYKIGDCLTELNGLKAGEFGIVEIDPPYAISLKDKRKPESIGIETYNEIEEERYLSFMSSLFKQCKRVMKPNSWLILWHAINWTNSLYELLEKEGFKTSYGCYGYWVKPTGVTMNPALMMTNSVEFFLYARLGNPSLNERGKNNYFQYPTVHHARRTHPTQRPLSMMKEILSYFGKPGEKVLVPFAGSGTTMIASHLLGMQSLGFDLSEDYKNGYILNVTKGDWKE